MRTEGLDPVVVDGGNLLFYKRELKGFEKDQLLRKARVLVEGYNHIGVDALALGPLDLAAGFDALRELQELARFPFLCANVTDRETGNPVFPPTAVVERGGFKVGLIGVMDSIMGARGFGPEGEEYRVEPLFSTVRHYAEQLKESGCDVIVVISAVPPKKFRLLAKDIEAVDLFVSGDPRDKLRIPYTVGSSMIANTTQLGKYLGHATIEVGVDDPDERITHQFVAMKPECPEDPEVKALVDGYYRYAGLVSKKLPEQYVRELEVEVNVKHSKPVFISAEECGTCHREIYGRWQESFHARALQQLPEESRNRVECLECHVTGLGLAGGFVPGMKRDMGGVQCEACHGAGSLHPAAEIERSGKDVLGVCRDCHTPSRSPNFRLKPYLDRLGCTQSAVRNGEPERDAPKRAGILDWMR